MWVSMLNDSRLGVGRVLGDGVTVGGGAFVGAVGAGEVGPPPLKPPHALLPSKRWR